MSKRSEMEAKIRKGPAMLGYAKFHDRLKRHVLELADDVDRLAAENATLTADRDSETRWACQYKAERDAANATLDALREVVKTGFTFQEVAERALAILYPTPETSHDHE